MTRNPLSAEELQRWMDGHPGWVEQHPNAARLLRKRLMQEQRRRRNQPTPLPPQP